MGKKTPIDMSVTEKDVLEVQAKWAAAIKAISAAFLKHKDFKMEDYQKVAADAAGEPYAYGQGPDVLFKPTKASVDQFRPTPTGAMSYFIGGARSKEDTLRTVASQ